MLFVIDLTMVTTIFSPRATADARAPNSCTLVRAPSTKRDIE